MGRIAAGSVLAFAAATLLHVLAATEPANATLTIKGERRVGNVRRREHVSGFAVFEALSEDPMH